MRKRCLLTLFLLLTFFFPCGNSDTVFAAKDKETYEIYLNLSGFKGLELYCYKIEGAWYSSLMQGTNRLKSAEEINYLQENYPCPIRTMKAVLATYKDVKPYGENMYVGIFIVSFLATEEEMENIHTPKNQENEGFIYFLNYFSEDYLNVR